MTEERRRPQYTVLYNIASPENDRWVGTGWEFFDKFEEAEACYQRHVRWGNCPTIRPFHSDDEKHLGAAHRY